MEPTELAIEVESLQLRYRGGWRRPPVDALAGVDLQLRKGEILGILGPNGSGKTTLLEILSGGLRKTSGRARVLDREAGDRALISRLGYQPEGPLPFPQLKPGEFLAYLGSLMGLSRPACKSRGEELLDRLGMASFVKRQQGKFSTGMQRRLALAAALLPEPELLLLDEPTSGLDPEASLLVMELLEEFRSSGGSILMASHHLQEVERVCDRVCVLVEGRKRAEGSLDALLGTDELLLAVTGLDAAGQDSVVKEVARAGGESQGWRRGRRHLFAFLRDLR
ncbi:MAG: ABC transporter ATP-binding protein [Planctomycetota bacterium]